MLPVDAILNELDAEVLLDFVERQPTIRDLAQKRGLSVLDFLAWWHSPPIAAALEALLQFQALRRELRSEQLRAEMVAILAQVARTSTSPVEQRRAATTALTHTRPLRHTHAPPSGELSRPPRPRRAVTEGAPPPTASTPPCTHRAPTPNGEGAPTGAAPAAIIAVSPRHIADTSAAAERSAHDPVSSPCTSAPIGVICGSAPHERVSDILRDYRSDRRARARERSTLGPARARLEPAAATHRTAHTIAASAGRASPAHLSQSRLPAVAGRGDLTCRRVAVPARRGEATSPPHPLDSG